VTQTSSSWLGVLREATGRLRQAGLEAPLRDARLLLGHALGVDQAGLIVRENDPVSLDVLDRFEAMVARRERGEPVSRIRGEREFYGRSFILSPDVLDPRPDTEVLIDACLARLPRGGRMLDLGVGSGCILLTVLAERPDATGIGADASRSALAVAERNAHAHCPGDRVELRWADWTLRDWTLDFAGERFDLVVSNPPYIPSGDIPDLPADVRNYDPLPALDGGRDGLDAYRRIIRASAGLLRPGGWLLLEVGVGQAGPVTALAASVGLTDLASLRDLAGVRRVVLARQAHGEA
jgi:release factor glutamine methyltransferase